MEKYFFTEEKTMTENTIKAILAAVMAAAGAYFRELLFPVLIMAAVMALDYISGMARAWAAKDLSSSVGLLGIIKKLLYLVAVAVAVVVDWVVQTAAAKMGIDVGGAYIFGLLVTIWLILNECISIIENISALGVPIPTFLTVIIKRLKQTTEQEGEQESGQATAGTGGGGHE